MAMSWGTLAESSNGLFLPFFFSGVFRFLRFFNILNQFRAIGKSIDKSMRGDGNETTSWLGRLITSAGVRRVVVVVFFALRIFCFICASAALVLASEFPCEATAWDPSRCNSEFQRFEIAFYFVCVTLTTVGFGDQSPATDAGRASIVCVMAVAVGIFPGYIADVKKAWANSAVAVGDGSQGLQGDAEVVSMLDRASKRAAEFTIMWELSARSHAELMEATSSTYAHTQLVAAEHARELEVLENSFQKLSESLSQAHAEANISISMGHETRLAQVHELQSTIVVGLLQIGNADGPQRTPTVAGVQVAPAGARDTRRLSAASTLAPSDRKIVL